MPCDQWFDGVIINSQYSSSVGSPIRDTITQGPERIIRPLWQYLGWLLIRFVKCTEVGTIYFHSSLIGEDHDSWHERRRAHVNVIHWSVLLKHVVTSTRKKLLPLLSLPIRLQALYIADRRLHHWIRHKKWVQWLCRGFVIWLNVAVVAAAEPKHHLWSLWLVRKRGALGRGS